jgi:hypothetical protein
VGENDNSVALSRSVSAVCMNRQGGLPASNFGKVNIEGGGRFWKVEASGAGLKDQVMFLDVIAVSL